MKRLVMCGEPDGIQGIEWHIERQFNAAREKRWHVRRRIDQPREIVYINVQLQLHLDIFWGHGHAKSLDARLPP
jgi:hypothetical protein